MSNPVLLVASLASSLAYTDRAGAGTLTGVDPIRYDNGLWLEQGTSNYARNQVAKNDTVQWGVDSTATWTRETTLPGPLPGWLAPLVTTCFKFTATANIVGGASSLVYTTNDAVPGAGTYIPAAYIWVPSSYGTAPLTIHGAAYTGGTTSEGSVDLGLRDQWQLCQGEQVVVGGDLTGVLGVVRSGGTIATGESFYLTLAMFQPAPLTSPAVGSFGMGYAFAGTVERSTSTRAASSASVATAEPVSVACWYREAYSGAKQFAYLDTLGQLGDYGDVSWAAGDLTISTSRNLVIGPFAAFDRELTAHEQQNLKSTQNWTMNSVNGSNIILPLSGARRRRR